MSFFDRTSFDLFDRKYKKGIDFENENVKSEFISFANAYKSISTENSINNIFKRTVDKNDDLVSLKAELDKCKTPHEIMYLIYNYVIKCSGLLVNESLLAIRLGINYRESKDWEKLKMDVLEAFQYDGVLGDSFERWWQNEILEWWKRTFGKSLKVMSAKEKVELIREKFGLQELAALQLPSYHRFDTFWYKCRLSDYPLETSDALKTTEMPRYVWQEPSYISMAYIMSDERDRKRISSLLGANEQRMFEEILSN